LSLTSKKQIESRCIAYLASLRVITFTWVNLLKERSHEALNDDERTELRSKAVEVALICAGSFNLDKIYLEGILKDPQEASILIQCSIIIQEGGHGLSNTSNQMIFVLHQRWKDLSYRAYPILAKQVVEENNPALDNAVTRYWSAHQAASSWSVVSDQAENWLVTQTTASAGSKPLSVHFNLLTSELLVNGLPLARLPSRYETHPVYSILFANSAIEVMPPTVQGMEFSGKEEYAGYKLQFLLNRPSTTSGNHDFLVQAAKGNKIYELVPSRIMRDHLPVSFIDGYVHWYDILDNSLEFRPIKDPWRSFTKNWRLSRSGSTWCLQRSGTHLIDLKSETAKVLSNILRPLEAPSRMHMFFIHSSATLEIELPRLQLGFHLKLGASSILSRQFRGMFIDSDQSLGTLVGLHNKLMLKDEKTRNRILVLPEGAVPYKASNDHVSVAIDLGTVTKAHTYNVDELLGRLVDNGSLQSKLLLCYIHALTSFCLPDPLTQRTGSDQALSILNSAVVRSFDRLEPEHIDILRRIAQLTPKRTYYPANERVMQKVSWSSSLSFLAQHCWFYKSVKSIFDQAKAAKMFYPGFYSTSLELDFVEPDLLERDCIRSSTFQVSGFGAEDHTTDHDKVYCPRDTGQDSLRGVKAFVISSFIYNMRTTLPYGASSMLKDDLWRFLSRQNQIFGPDKKLETSLLRRYDSGLLLDSSKFLSENWCALHKILSGNWKSAWDNRFLMMIWFSTLAFAKDANMGVIQTLAAFHVLLSMARVSIPSIPAFRLREGIKPIKSRLFDVIKTALRPFPDCPDAKLTHSPEETPKKFQNHVRSGFKKNQTIAVERLWRALEDQWKYPLFVPLDIDEDTVISNHIDVDKAIEAVTPIWGTWYDNRLLSQYLDETSKTLAAHTETPIKIPTSTFVVPEYNPSKGQGFISIDDIFACSTPPSFTYDTSNLSKLLSSTPTSDQETYRLAGLIKRLEDHAGSKYEQDYTKDLRESLVCLREWEKEYNLTMAGARLKATLADHLDCCKRNFQTLHRDIMSSINFPKNKKGSDSKKMNYFLAMTAGIKQIPRLSPILLLQQLTRSRWQKLSEDWRRCIVQYGLAIVELRRAERLITLSGTHAELIAELQNPGHKNWDPSQYPESLLLEVESGIVIREMQENIAVQMRSPESGKNAVMQLNMGEGKSSVIVPIVASSLADGARLVRIIVAKPQSKQMFQMLVTKLGGLLNRRVYHMPFSRSLKLGKAEVDKIGILCRECKANGGVLLVHPEHVLSFKLMGLECMNTGKEATGSSLLGTQSFFDSSSRDIVDESDENFSVKFELIYTMGTQRPIELSPERWTCIQQVLEVVRKFAPGVKKAFPLSMDMT